MNPRAEREITFSGNEGPAATWPSDLQELAREERLYEREDWEGLVRLRRRGLRSCPCPDCAAGLGEALLLAERPAEALEVLQRGIRDDPGDRLVTELILNALRRLGRPFDDFPWPEAPRVFLLDDALELCLRHLQGIGKAMRVSTLRGTVFSDAFVDFDAAELADAARRDRRFLLAEDEHGQAVVSLAT